MGLIYWTWGFVLILFGLGCGIGELSNSTAQYDQKVDTTTVHNYGKNFNDKRKELGLILIPESYVKTENKTQSQNRRAAWVPPKKILESLPRHTYKVIQFSKNYHYEEDCFYSGRTYLEDNNEGPWHPPTERSEQLLVKYDYKTNTFECKLYSSKDSKDPKKAIIDYPEVSEAKKILASWKVKVDWD